MRALRNLRSEAGFTLVEMSIVLVIIGLIVGGILKGQEIVNDGKIKIQVAQIDALKSATGTFYDKFAFFPGDFKAGGVLLSGTTIDGDENGIVNATGSTAGLADDAANGNEMDFALEQMQLANLITGVLPNGTSTTEFYYQGKLNNSILYYGDIVWPTGSASVKSVRIQAAATKDIAPTPAVRTSDALSIDTKYDDGLPLNGTIFASAASATANCCSGGSCADAATSTSVTYNNTGSQNAANCVLIWQIQ